MLESTPRNHLIHFRWSSVSQIEPGPAPTLSGPCFAVCRDGRLECGTSTPRVADRPHDEVPRVDGRIPLIREKKAAATSVYHGKTYHFRSAGCKTTFEKEPGTYAKA